MAPHDVLAELDRRIQTRSILRHPFYTAWRNGTLTREQLSTYAAVYYPHVAAFPEYIRTAIAQSGDPVVTEELARNLEDELTNPRPHPELWLDFAEGMSLDRQEVTGRLPRPAAAGMMATFTRLCGQSSAAALAALYAYESQQPEVSREKISGLKQHYGVEDGRTLAYFEVHAEADQEHRAGERRMLGRCLTTGASPAEVFEAADAALDAYWGLLDGIAQDAGVVANC